MKRRNLFRRYGNGLRPVFGNDAGDDGGDGQRQGDGAGDGEGGGEGAGSGAGDDGGAGGGAGGEGGEGDQPTNWFSSAPENWRNDALSHLGIDEKSEDYQSRMNMLERVSDTPTLLKNYFEAQDKIRKGEVNTGLPENPTDEQMAAYREANGIPAEPKDYQLQLDEGLVVGEGDQRIFDRAFEVAHAENVPNEAVSKLANVFLQGRQADADAILQQDGLDKQTVERQLKEQWGGDYQRNLNAVEALVSKLPSEVADEFKNARMGNGTALLNSAPVVSALAEWMAKIDPAATLVPNSSDPMRSISDEIKSLEQKMQDGIDDGSWDKDKDSQKRLMDLYDARDQMNAA